MKERLNVAITGYVGTGSSAVIDLLKEFNCCGVALGKDRDYEHIPFYADNGLFDLGAILMNVNSSLRSDTAISSFIESMKWLNNNNFGWFGSYKWLVGDKFDRAVQKFVTEISQPIKGKSYSHYVGVKFSVFKICLQIAAKFVYGRPVTRWGREYIYDKKQMYFSMPTADEFIEASRKFTNEYFDMCAEPQKEIMIYDHLLWPQQANLTDAYFDDNFKMIIVMRDARDLYTLNKHYWYKPPLGNGNPLFPTDARNFSDYWKRVRGSEGEINTKKVIYINFEDLIYKYDETLKRLMEFLGLSEKQHEFKRRFFNPDKSIKNTQTYRIQEEWEKEADIIFDLMPEYTYDFPFINDTSLSDMFDTPANTPIKK